MVVSNELEQVWKEAVIVLSQHLPEGAEENHKNPDSG
jgi:hypothetical protein